MVKLMQIFGLNVNNEEPPKPLAIFALLFAGSVLVMLMSGCATRAGCDSWDYIYVVPEDSLETKRQVLAHNLVYQELCS